VLKKALYGIRYTSGFLSWYTHETVLLHHAAVRHDMQEAENDAASGYGRDEEPRKVKVGTFPEEKHAVPFLGASVLIGDVTTKLDSK
jgi:hypothetical protein